jgi:hypothetical protein
MLVREGGGVGGDLDCRFYRPKSPAAPAIGAVRVAEGGGAGGPHAMAKQKWSQNLSGRTRDGYT